MRALFKLLLFFCYAGIAASAAVHLFAMTLSRTVPTALVFALHLGVFLAGLPTSLGMRRLVKPPYPKPFGRVFWSGTPRWLRYLSRGAFGYFVVVFVVYLRFTATHQPPSPRTGSFPPATLVMFSAGWLSAYAALAAGLRFLIDVGEEPTSQSGRT